jgi:putative SOS response-associated peptidase YedK
MCGRYVINNQTAIEAAFKVAHPQWDELRDSYNVAPSQSVPVIR